MYDRKTNQGRKKITRRNYLSLGNQGGNYSMENTIFKRNMLQLNKHETEPYFLQFFQNNTYNSLFDYFTCFVIVLNMNMKLF